MLGSHTLKYTRHSYPPSAVYRWIPWHLFTMEISVKLQLLL